MELLTASEIIEFKSAIAKTLDVGALLNGKCETDAKALLEYLKQQKLIVAEKTSS